jgi:hypothetical protein
MSSELTAAISDVVLSVGTFVLGMNIGKRKASRTWTALFLNLAFASALGALYHGLGQFHTREFYAIVAALSTSSAFLFLSAVLTMTRPSSSWLPWLWPILGAVGLLVGGVLSEFPFWSISIVSGLCLLYSVFLLARAPASKARKWIYFGVALTIIALVIQKTVGNGAFHYTQLCANFLFWIGARHT